MQLFRKRKMKFKLFCRGNHWYIIPSEQGDKRVLLATPRGYDIKATKRLIEVLDKQIREQVFADICAAPLLEDRKKIVKMGIDNAVLMAQDICARLALGKHEIPVKKSEDGAQV